MSFEALNLRVGPQARNPDPDPSLAGGFPARAGHPRPCASESEEPLPRRIAKVLKAAMRSDTAQR